MLVGMHLFAWGLSAVIVVAGLAVDVFGWSKNVCWIMDSFDSWWMPAYYVPAAVVIVYSLFAYGAVSLSLRRIVDTLDSMRVGAESSVATERRGLSKMNYNLEMRVATMLLILGGWLALEMGNRIYTLITGETLETFAMFVSILSPLQSVSTVCLLYTSPSPRDRTRSRMPSSA